MQYRQMGKTNEKVSVLGFGCMRFQVKNGKNDQIDEEKAITQLRMAIDKGVNYIDTAYPYHEGNSEIVVGKALENGYREKVKLATKLPSWLIKSRQDMDKYLDEQLAKLRTQYIDFYLIHALRKEFWENLKKNDIFDFIDKALKSGKIKHIGFSFHDEYEVFKEITDSYDWDFCQIQFNFMDTEYQAGLKGLRYAAEKGMGIVIMEPLRGGSLVNKVPPQALEIYNNSGYGRTPAEWELRYIWDYKEVSVILSGMNEESHIIQNMNTASQALPGSLTEKEKNIIEEVKKIYLSKIKVNCTKCQYCMPCPFGVDIPGNFAMYNEYGIYGNFEDAKYTYNEMSRLKKSDALCKECGRCEPLCPQSIPIPQRLKEITKLFIGSKE